VAAEIKLSDVHRGTGGVLLHEFLRVQLGSAKEYRRAVAYFSASVFSVAAEDFVSFFRAGGQMELICSPHLSLQDIHSLQQGLYNSRRWAGFSADDVLRIPRSERGRATLSWAIAVGRLDIRIALLQSPKPTAVYHEKIGVFSSTGKRLVGFLGSANESSNAYVDNFERIVSHDSEVSPLHQGEAHRLAAHFEMLWSNDVPGLTVIPLHDAFAQGVIRIREDGDMNSPNRTSSPPPEIPPAPPEFLRRPARLALRDYQERAIDCWFAAGGKGVFSMATGTGKTITALSMLEELYRRCGSPLAIIIVAPYINLVEQWKSVAKAFGLDPITCYGSRSTWVGAVEAATYLLNSGHRPLFSLLTTNATFAQEPFQAALQSLSVRTVIVADEVHNLGARNLQSKLPPRISLRLGLSATPERWMDEDGTKAISDYFGPTVFSLDLNAALQLDPPVLTPYTYHPVLVELDADEKEEYLRITRQLARYIVSPKTENLSDVVLGLLLQRARLVACARRKLPALAKVIEPYRDTRYNLVYCGDGQAEIDAASASGQQSATGSAVVRQVDAAARLLGNDLGMNVGIYTSDVSNDDRAVILGEFESGRKNALVAIRCLDEGVDIPNVRRAFILASSTNPRQFIQRRGRVLRRAEGKDIAEIFDFVAVPPFDSFDAGTAEYRVMRNLVTKEMARVTEFAQLAINGPQAYGKLLPILSALKLMHI